MSDSSSISSTTVFRRLHPADWNALKTVGTECLPIVYPDDYWKMLTADNGVHFALGAFFDNQLVATVAVVRDVMNSYVTPHMKREETLLIQDYDKVCYISSLVVTEKMRRRGIATQLMTAVMEQLQTEEGIEAFYLHVMAGNTKAISLYEKLGFVREAHFRGYYNQMNLLSNAFLYVRRLRASQPSGKKCACSTTYCHIL